MHGFSTGRGARATRLLATAAILALALGLPVAAQAQDVCNAQFNIDYLSGPNFGVAGDNYTVEVGIGTGTISGGANNQITISQWRFELDCANNPFIGCVDEGAIVGYLGDATISVGGTGCVDINGAPVGFSSNNAGGGTSPNQLIFTPSAPVVLDANVDSTSDAACKVSFGIQLANAPGTDATPFLVQESAGFTAVPPFDANCDQPNPIPGTAAQSGQIPLCQLCDDGNECTTESCNQTSNVCETTFTQVCDDGNACTTEACNTASGACETSFTQTCDDGNACTTEACNTASGACETSFTQTCDDGNACTTEACNTASGACETSFTQTCGDGNACTDEICNTSTGQCQTTNTQTCDDGNACTTEACNTANGACETSFTQTCNDQNACTTEACNTASGACETSSTVTCPDPTCEECNTATGTCEDQDPLPVACAPVGCRITAGGITPDGETDSGVYAVMGGKLTFGGQVGAPCGCIDCFDEFGNIEGQWQHNRHKRKGRIHTSLYRSLICQLDDGEGPEPRPAPANRACWTGLGRIAMSGARNDPRTEPVIVRVDVEDRGEPGGGQNAGDPDFYRIRAWDPSGLSDQEVEDLFAGICCKTYFEPDSVQPPTGSVLLVDDGGEPGIIHGNIQIHPVLPNTEKGICPPRQSCFE